MRKTRINRVMAMLLALVMALAITAPALAADAEDYTTVTGTWEYKETPAIGMVTFTNCNDPSNPSVVVVPSIGSANITIEANAIKNPNMTVISLPKEFLYTFHDLIYNCTKIVYRGTKADWDKRKPSFGNTKLLPRRIPVVTLDGEVIDTVGPSWWPADSGPLATKEYLAMTAVMEQYPNYSHWSFDSTYTWNGGIWYGPVDACQGFAMMVSDAAFGNLPAKEIVYKQWSDIRVGDILMLSKIDHAVIVLEVYDDYVIVAEGNVNGSYVEWGAKYSKSFVEYAITDVVTRWPDRTGAITTFTDVPGNAWYYDAVKWAVGKNITNGTSATTFSPTKICSHVEVITFLYRAAGSPKTDAVLPFAVKNAWATDALKWAYSKGIIDASFNEGAACTRYDAVTYIWRAFGSPTPSNTVIFDDIAGLDSRPIAWGVSRRILYGTGNGKFSPDLTCDRGTVTTLLYRSYK